MINEKLEKDFNNTEEGKEENLSLWERFKENYIIWNIIYYWEEFLLLFKEPKYAWQRVNRGYSDRDLWNVDYALIRIIPPMVRSLKGGISHPGSLCEEGKSVEEGNADWQIILEKIARGFEAAGEIGEMKFMHKENDKVEYDDEAKKVEQKMKDEMNEGFKLFHKHFFGLWD